MKSTTRQWRRSGDHYYWLTAFLAARDLQRRTCRLVAATILGLGLIGPIIATGPYGVRGTAGLVTLAITGACCVAMAALWLRSSWPSRSTSQVCVVVGSACAAASCELAPTPLLGMIGTAAFAILASYVAFFHSLRLLAFVWLVAAVVTAHLAVELAEVDVSMTLGIVLLLVMVNAFAVFACRMVIRLIADDTPHNDLDPLTGLLNRDGFYDAVATLLGARNRGDDLRLVVVVLSLDGYSLLSSLHGIAGLDRARVAVARALRETARRDAVVAHPGDAEFWVADVFDTVDPSPLAERLRSAVATAEYRLTASVGVVCTPLAPLVKPAAYDVVEELLTIAVAAMFDVRKRGGNRTRTVIDPELAVLNEPGVDD